VAPPGGSTGAAVRWDPAVTGGAVRRRHRSAAAGPVAAGSAVAGPAVAGPAVAGPGAVAVRGGRSGRVRVRVSWWFRRHSLRWRPTVGRFAPLTHKTSPHLTGRTRRTAEIAVAEGAVGRPKTPARREHRESAPYRNRTGEIGRMIGRIYQVRRGIVVYHPFHHGSRR